MGAPGGSARCSCLLGRLDPSNIVASGRDQSLRANGFPRCGDLLADPGT